MPLFLWIYTVATVLIEWFAKYFTRRVACIAAFITILASLILGLYASVQLLIDALNFVPAAQPFTQWLEFLLPSNTKFCLITLIANRLIHQVFAFEKEVAAAAVIKC